MQAFCQFVRCDRADNEAVDGLKRFKHQTTARIRAHIKTLGDFLRQTPMFLTVQGLYISDNNIR